MARDAAIAMVRDAAAAGRITPLDRDHRIMELQHAESDADIEVHLRDLRLPVDLHPPAPSPAQESASPTVEGIVRPNPGAAPDPARRPAATRTPWESAGATQGPAYGAQRSGGTYVGLGTVQQSLPAGAKRGFTIGCLLLVVFAIVVPVVSAFFVLTAVRDGGSSSGVIEVPQPQPDDVRNHTRDGIDRLVSAVRSETGTTVAFSAVIYPDYAVVDVPLDSSSNRYRTWYWNGDLRETGVGSTVTSERFDLAEVESKVLLRLLKQAERGVEDPTSRYLIIRGPDRAGPATVMAYATNDFGETSYVRATFDGTILG